MGLREQEVLDVLQIVKDNKFTSVCMLGVQDIELVWEKFDNYIQMFDYAYDKISYERIKGKYPINAYEFFRCFGVKDVHALDCSAYEGADILFDLNSANLDGELKFKFDMVIDGGTLEHIFCSSNAIKNMVNLVKSEGIVYHVVPCNGVVNHGFYSFSPTFFLDFYLNNGFEIRELTLHSREWGRRDPLIRSQDCRTFPTARSLNLYIEKYMRNDEVFIKCVAKKKNYVEQMDNEPTQRMFKEIYQRTEAFLFDFTNVKLKEFLEKNNKLAFYGVGKDCECLINELYKNDFEQNLEMLFDSDINRAGEEYRGKTIYYPTKRKLLRAERILISSSKYENEIMEFLLQQGVDRERIVRLTELQ